MVLLGVASHAQTPMSIPNGSFEQWTNHSDYSVTVFYMPFEVYGSYSTPSNWDYPSYPVNQTVSMMGMNININTNIPLIKATAETNTVPDGNKAVKLQTFMLDDIINSTLLSLAGDYIDTSISQQIIPSILSTGAVNLEAIIPILSNMMTDSVDLTSMIPTLLAMDVNDYITGGLALNGFKPGHLSGFYKYHSATSGDNGGVVLLGTHYNTVTHQRDIVGGGINLALTDTGVYSYFETEYQTLGELMPNMPDIAPDTLVVLLISSASNNRQQGSYLCLDNIVLWPAPATCPDITAFSATPGINEVLLDWTVSDTVDNFELEYGTAGFSLGSGISTTTSATSISLTALESNTTYDVYLRTLCSDTIYGDWSLFQFSTLGDTCATVRNLEVKNIVYDAFPEMVMEWHGSSQPEHWEVEYGPQGFEHGTGTLVETNYSVFEIYTLENNGTLSPNTWYDFYVRSVCDDNVYGEWDSVHYRTFCATVNSPSVNSENIQVDANNHLEGYSISWTDNTETNRWSVYYGIYNQQFPDNWGTYAEVDTPYFEFPPLNPGKTYSVEISAYCGEDNYGDIVWVNFTTQSLEGIEDPQSTKGKRQLSIMPNPANGHCKVTITDNQPAELKLYSIDGRLIESLHSDGSPIHLFLPWQGLFLIQATTATGTMTYKIVNN